MFDVSKQRAQLCAITMITDIPSIPFHRVNVAVKIMEIQEVTGGKLKRDVIVADASGSIVLTLWEDSIHEIVENKSF